MAAVSCGIVDGECRLDLEYVEDSAAQADANFVLTENGVAGVGISQLCELQTQALK